MNPQKLKNMDFSTYWWLTRPLLALLASYLIARKMRQFLLSLVIQSMPIAQRYSEDGFKKQTRIVSRLGIGLTILLAIGIEVGYRQFIAPKYQPTSFADLPTKDLNMMPIAPPAILSPQKTAPNNQFPPVSPPLVSAPPVPMTVSAPPLFYLQLAAFSHPTAIQKAKAAHAARVPHPLSMATDAHPTAPYKLVVGPFPSRAEARQYRQHYGLRGYVRPAELLQIWQE
jgi:hypothetical protein